jgi:hypothetical protein
MAIRNDSTLARGARQRKKRFLHALIEADQSMSAWARAQGVTPGHVSQVLDGKRPGLELDTKIEQFIAKYLPDQLRRAS